MSAWSFVNEADEKLDQIFLISCWNLMDRLLSANCHMIQSALTPGEAMVERKYGLAFEIYSLHVVTFQRQGTWYIL
jgi:hypothetical protein